MKRPAQYCGGMAVLTTFRFSVVWDVGGADFAVVDDVRSFWIRNFGVGGWSGWRTVSWARAGLLDTEDSPLTLRLLVPRLLSEPMEKDWVRLESTLNVRDFGMTRRGRDAVLFSGFIGGLFSLLVSLIN